MRTSNNVFLLPLSLWALPRKKAPVSSSFTIKRCVASPFTEHVHGARARKKGGKEKKIQKKPKLIKLAYSVGVFMPEEGKKRRDESA